MDYRRFSLVVAWLGIVFAIGVHIDGWAHNHGRVDESFFTPWHAVLYGTYFAVAGVIVARIVRTRASGRSWADSIPQGYILSVAGIVVFFAAGIGDLLWHVAFGVEEDLEALLSPTHLALATGGMLMGVGPYLAGIRSRSAAWKEAAPAVVTSLALLSFVAFMTQFANPYVELWPTEAWRFADPVTNEIGAALGVAGFLWHAAVLSGFVLALAGRNCLPSGAAALLIAGSAAFAVTQGDEQWLVLPALIGALGVEAARAMLPDTRLGFRLFSFLVPALPIAAHICALAIAFDVVWSIHLAAGTPFLAGLVGVLIGVLVVPADARV